MEEEPPDSKIEGKIKYLLRLKTAKFYRTLEEINNSQLNSKQISELEIKIEERQLLRKVKAEQLRTEKKYRLPKNTGFCELLLYKESICNGKRYRDTNCFETKARGCAIYHRYQFFKRISKNQGVILGLLKISEHLLPIKKG